MEFGTKIYIPVIMESFGLCNQSHPGPPHNKSFTHSIYVLKLWFLLGTTTSELGVTAAGSYVCTGTFSGDSVASTAATVTTASELTSELRLSDKRLVNLTETVFIHSLIYYVY